MTPVLQSPIAGRWLGRQPALTLASAVDGRALAVSHAEAIDFEGAGLGAGQVVVTSDVSVTQPHGQTVARRDILARVAKQPPAPGTATR